MEGVCARVDEVERWGGCGILKIGYGDALLLDIAHLNGQKNLCSRNHIIHTGTIYVLLSIALNVSRRQMIAPVPLGTEALSSSLKAPVICVGGLMLFLISMGCS